MIPKKIHYCWFGNTIPENNVKIIASWKEIMPDYEFYFWENTHLENCDVKFVKQAFRKRHFAFVSDYFRLLKVYEYGGIYLDTDMLLTSRLDVILDKEFVICSEVPGLISWAFFGSSPQNSFLKECYEKYHYMEYDQFKPPVIPYLLNNITSDYISQNKLDRVNLSPDYFYPMPADSVGLEHSKYIQKNTLGVHLWDFSWHEIKKSRTNQSEIPYRLKTLFFDFISFSYTPYYFKINIIRIIRLIKFRINSQ